MPESEYFREKQKSSELRLCFDFLNESAIPAANRRFAQRSTLLKEADLIANISGKNRNRANYDDAAIS
jgi:hypothetical protein